MRSRLIDTGDPDLVLREIVTDRLTLRFLPSVGGRLLSLAVDGSELLWHNPEIFGDGFVVARPRSTWPPVDGIAGSWTNVGGSKSWPAPQGTAGPSQWDGPPDPVLDSGVWSWHETHLTGVTRVEMSSPPDPRTGLRMTRRFDIPDRGLTFTQRLDLRNVSSRTVRWAPWEVCQVGGTPPGGAARVRVATSDHTAANLGDYLGSLALVPTAQGFDVPVQDAIGKRGFPTASGAIAWVNADGASVRLRFHPHPEGEYPDHGSRAEVWVQCPVDGPVPGLDGYACRDYYLELEVLGPLATLRPGEATDFEIQWEAVRAG